MLLSSAAAAGRPRGAQFLLAVATQIKRAGEHAMCILNYSRLCTSHRLLGSAEQAGSRPMTISPSLALPLSRLVFARLIQPMCGATAV